MVKRFVVLVLVLSMALAGCGGQSEVRGDDYSIFVHGRSLLATGGNDALVGGILVTRDGCVLLADNEDLDNTFPVIWPPGTSITSEDPLTLRHSSGGELIVGQVIRGGGGYLQASSDDVEVDIPAECVGETGEVAVFNPDTDLSITEG